MKRKFFTPFPALVVAFLITTVALAQSGGMYDLSWNVFDGGGATFSTGGAYSLGGTAAQPEAGEMNGGIYSLTGGFWQTLDTATAIDLVSFDARFKNDHVNLEWVTASERETMGYNVWRSANGAMGDYAKINFDLIPPRNPGVDGMVQHEYTDAPEAGDYFYKIEIVKAGNDSEWSNAVNVSVGAACATKPTRPKLVSPNNDAALKKARVTLKWKTVQCATNYTLVVRRDSRKGQSVINEQNITGNEFKTNALKRTVTYYWQVRACNANGCKKSAWQSFSINAKK